MLFCNSITSFSGLSGLGSCYSIFVLEEVQAVLLAPEDGFLLIPAGGDVVNSTRDILCEGDGP